MKKEELMTEEQILKLKIQKYELTAHKKIALKRPQYRVREALASPGRLKSPLPLGGRILEVIYFFIFLLVLCYPSFLLATEQWPGVDKSVVEKYAKEHGRETKEPLINTDKGDLLLFVFLLAGAVGGFAAGYYWRQLTETGRKVPKNSDKSYLT